eukprot:SAG22_NODE_10517_length_530_cov_0.960557_1_plen_122_part_10
MAKRLWPRFTNTSAFELHEDIVLGVAFGAATSHDCVTISEDGELAVVDCDGPSVDIRIKLGHTPKCLAVRGTACLVGCWNQPTQLLRVDLDDGSIVELLGDTVAPAAAAVAAAGQQRPRGRV